MPVLRIKVHDRKDALLAEVYEEFTDKSTVLDLMQQILKSDKFKKRNMDINRMRLTLNDSKGIALSDKRALLITALNAAKVNLDEPIKLIFKDLGMQISWKLVFLVEYFGPILVSCLFMFFQKQIYGEVREYNF